MTNTFVRFFKTTTIILALVFIGCTNHTTAPVTTTNDTEEQKELIKKTLIQMWDAIEKEDMERYATFIHPDFTQFGETDPVLRIGKENELKGIRSWVAESENIHTEMIDPKVTIYGRMAYITYYWSDHGTTNGVAFATKGKSTRIFVNDNGKWLCIHGHYTLLPQGYE